MAQTVIADLLGVSPQTLGEVIILIVAGALARLSFVRIRRERHLGPPRNVCPNCLGDTVNSECPHCDGHRIVGDW